MTLPVRVSPSISLAPFFPFYLLVLLFFHPRHPGLRSLWPIVTERKKVSRVERERERELRHRDTLLCECYSSRVRARTHARATPVYALLAPGKAWKRRKRSEFIDQRVFPRVRFRVSDRQLICHRDSTRVSSN